jgi:hypothetical protein
MKKSEARNLRQNQRVYCGGYEWKVYKACPYVNGISDRAMNKLEKGECDGYRIWLKAIDGRFYPLGGRYRPLMVPLDKQWWCGIEADYKEVEVKNSKD